MIRKEKPLREIAKGLEFGNGGSEYKPGKPGTITPEKPVKPGKPKPVKPGKPGDIPPQRPIKPGKPKPIDFGKVLGQQPITMGEGYRDEINTIRPRGNGSAMNKQYRAQGGGRFK